MSIKVYTLKNKIIESSVEEYIERIEEVKKKRNQAKKAAKQAAELAKQNTPAASDTGNTTATVSETPQKPIKEKKEPRTVFVTTPNDVSKAFSLAGIRYEGEILLDDIEFCKVESQKKCLCGNLSIPKLSDVLADNFKMFFFVNRKNIVIIDNEGFAEKIMERIITKRTNPGESRERFLYNFCAQFMDMDLDNLGRYAQRIMWLEEEIAKGELDLVTEEVAQIRKELLILREYYDELHDFGKQLEENENHFFSGKNLEYFGVISDRADRLMGRTMYLLDYISQVRETYQGKVAEQQNKNMEFLTIISTIFFPLTLITGWYGMNFQNMPELAQGYPFVIILSLLVIAVIILIFKKRKIL